jgi:mono/diheme cytochrome c family protein
MSPDHGAFPGGCILRLAVILVLGACLAAGMARGSAHQANTTGGSTDKLAQGQKLFHERCGYCHLAGGTGTIMLARRLGKDRALLEQRTDLSADYIKKITRVGINGMPPHNRIEVPDSELELIALYLTRPVSAREASAAAGSPANGARP